MCWGVLSSEAPRKRLPLDATDPFRLDLDTGAVAGLMHCPRSTWVDRTVLGKLSLHLSALLPSVCPLKYDAPTLWALHHLWNQSQPASPLVPVSCNESLTEVARQDRLWGVQGVRILASLRVCLFNDTDAAPDCDLQAPQGVWAIQTSFNLSQSVPCFTWARRLQNTTDPAAAAGGRYAPVQEVCWAHLTHRQGMHIYLSNVDTMSDHIPRDVDRALNAMRRRQTPDTRFLTDPLRRSPHLPVFSQTVRIPLTLLTPLVDAAGLARAGRKLMEDTRRRIERHNAQPNITDTTRIVMPKASEFDLAQCFLMMSDAAHVPAENITHLNEAMEEMLSDFGQVLPADARSDETVLMTDHLPSRPHGPKPPSQKKTPPERPRHSKKDEL